MLKYVTIKHKIILLFKEEMVHLTSFYLRTRTVTSTATHAPTNTHRKTYTQTNIHTQLHLQTFHIGWVCPRGERKTAASVNGPSPPPTSNSVRYPAPRHAGARDDLLPSTPAHGPSTPGEAYLFVLLAELLGS